MKRELAAAYTRIGGVKLLLSDTTGAMTSYDLSLQLLEALAGSDPKDAQARRDLSSLCNNIGDLHSKLGDRARAKASYSRSLQLCEATRQRQPERSTDGPQPLCHVQYTR